MARTSAYETSVADTRDTSSFEQGIHTVLMQGKWTFFVDRHIDQLRRGKPSEPIEIRKIKIVQESLPCPVFFMQLALYCLDMVQFPENAKCSILSILVLIEPTMGIILAPPLVGDAAILTETRCGTVDAVRRRPLNKPACA